MYHRFNGYGLDEYREPRQFIINIHVFQMFELNKTPMTWFVFCTFCTTVYIVEVLKILPLCLVQEGDLMERMCYLEAGEI